MGRNKKDYTEKAMIVFDYILKKKLDGTTPTIREMCNDLGIASTSTAHRYLNVLCEMGLIEKPASEKRSLKVVNNEICNVPILGSVSSYNHKSKTNKIEGYVTYSNYKGNPSDLFALKVIGNDMENVAILDNDLVIVKKQKEAESGNIVVAVVDDKTVVKTYLVKEDKVLLQSENSHEENSSAFFPNDINIIGKVIGITRFLS